MKEKKIAIMAWAVMLSASVFADDVYTNQKTVSAAEEIDGNLYVGDNAAAEAAEPASLTIENGGKLMVGSGVFLGNRPGNTLFTIKTGGEFVATNLNDQGIRVGTAADAHVSITNSGTMLVQTVEYGDENNSSAVKGGSVEFHNFGSMRVLNNFRIGYSNTGKSSLFHHHEGASLSLEGKGQYKLYVGGRRDGGTWIIDDDVSVASKMWIGLAKGEGRVFLNKNATMTMDPGDEIRLGYEANSTGRVCMANNSSIIGKAVVSVGRDTSSVGSIVMSNNTVIAVTNQYGIGVAGGAKSKGYVELNDNAKLFDGNKLTVGVGESSYGHLVLKDNSQIDVKSDFVVAGGAGSTGVVEFCNYTGLFNESPVYGNAAGSLAVLRLSGTTDYAVPAQFNLGAVAGSTGMIEAKDNSTLRLPHGYLIHGVVGATGVVSVCDNASLLAASNKLQVGGDANKTGYLTVKDDALVSVSNLCVAYQWEAKSNIRGVLEVADNAVVTNVTALSIGRGKTALGVVYMRGGSLFFDYRYRDGNALVLGDGNAVPNALICGWGFMGFDDAKKTMVDYEETFGAGSKWAGMTFCGRIVADGEGVERTLDLSRAPIASYLADSYNSCGTNGFYAVNKGRLKFQRCLPRRANNHKQIGIKPDHGSPLMVNGFQYTFDSETMNALGTYVFSELYAVDRSDIPAGLPTGKGIHHSAVWRIGHFNETATPDVDDEDLTADHKQNFNSLKLKFHYDPAFAEIEDVRHVKVYRCTDSVNGGWTCVASITAPDSASPYIETVEMAPSSELWNGGWFAIVGTPRVGTVMVLR